ncbi:MAG TPA: DNA-3-methyladenine glycosylase [Chitinophagaceae bacterium]|jgi:DNA-3-methyladenine glycosylase|nr:DNA-3-methyladenine glycosylase [Chitinophagaceae bacterium]
MQIDQLKKLPNSFYTQKNVCSIAKNLLGKILVTQFNEIITACTIVETEAYNGIVDKASHSYKNRRTSRTEIMFANGGLTYVYLCYGIHYLFNVVTNTINQPHAVLIRAGEPVFGIETMLQRTGKTKADYTLTKGPGNLCKAMGINNTHNGLDISGNEIFIAQHSNSPKKQSILTTKRIGVDYAQEDALLPYRFILANNLYVSGKKSQNIAV